MTIAFTIRGYIGNPRSGKTISMVSDGHDTFLEIKEMEYYLKKKQNSGKKLSKLEKSRLEIFSKFEIMSNLKLNKRIYGKYHKVTFDKIIEMYKNNETIEYKLILLDDLFKELDSYDVFSKKEKHKFSSYFFKEIGKKENIVYYVSHYDMDITKRLRKLTEVFVYCRKGSFKKVELPSGNIFSIFIEDENYYDLQTQEELKNMVIHQIHLRKFMTMSDLMNSDVKRKIKKQEYLTAHKFFNHYDTKEVV